MRLELADSSIHEDPSDEQVSEALGLLTHGSNDHLLLHKSPASVLRVVSPQPRRYYLYHEGLREQRAVQPVSLAQTRRMAAAYVKGKRGWQGNVRFETLEADPGDHAERDVSEVSTESLRLSLRRVELAALLPSILLFLGLTALVAWGVGLEGWQTSEGLFKVVAFWFVTAVAVIAAFRARSAIRSELARRVV